VRREVSTQWGDTWISRLGRHSGLEEAERQSACCPSIGRTMGLWSHRRWFSARVDGKSRMQERNERHYTTTVLFVQPQPHFPVEANSTRSFPCFRSLRKAQVNIDMEQSPWLSSKYSIILSSFGAKKHGATHMLSWNGLFAVPKLVWFKTFAFFSSSGSYLQSPLSGPINNSSVSAIYFLSAPLLLSRCLSTTCVSFQLWPSFFSTSSSPTQSHNATRPPEHVHHPAKCTAIARRLIF